MALHVGANLGGATPVDRIVALEVAVTALDAAVAKIAQAIIDNGNRTQTALESAIALGLPQPPPLPSTVSS